LRKTGGFYPDWQVSQLKHFFNLAWLTVSYQSVKAATANPANLLKTE